MNTEKVTVDGQLWLVREATNLDQAMHAIAMARCTGSVGSKHTENGVVLADMVRLNADGSERKAK